MEKAISVFCYSNDNEAFAEDLSGATFVIRMLSGEFCLAVLAKDGSVRSLNQYTFSPNLSIEEKITAMEDARKPFHLACGKAVFQLYTGINTQIPEEFYVENLNNTIADLLTTHPKEYVPVGEKIAGEPLYNLSLWNAVLLKKIKEKFPHYELKTTICSLLTKILRRKPQEETFVFVEDNNFTIIAKNTKGLLACNSFAFETEADFLYYCLYFMRKMYKNIETIPVTLCGNITAQSSLFVSIKKYVAKVELAVSEDNPIANEHYYYDII